MMKTEMKLLFCYAFIFCCTAAAATNSPYFETCNITSSIFQATEVLPEVEQLLKREILRQRYLGELPEYAAKSYEELKEIKPCLTSSGFWIKIQNKPSKIIANIDMQAGTQCPPELEMVVNSTKRLCRSPLAAAGCASVHFPVGGTLYNTVYGRLIGYQYYSTCAFEPGPGKTIEEVYVDGVSITHGSNPRKHIWTFAVGYDELTSGSTNGHCPCVQPAAASNVPTFVGTDYYCDTGSHARYTDHLYIDNAVWDGQGCGPTSTCCDDPNLPWFTKQLRQPTSDDIELRICRTSDRNNEDILLESIELYIQIDPGIRVANVNMMVDTKCPVGLELFAEQGKRLCRRPGGTGAGAGCDSVIFSVNTEYSEVWGKVIGYQYGVIDGFNGNRPLDGSSAPIDGIVITHGENPRKHIWTYAVGNSEAGTAGTNQQCPCTHPSAASEVPSFAGSDYYCDTGSTGNPTQQLYLQNPLWDGEGCGPTSTCCDDPNLPWFIKELGQTTTEDIEFRVCNDGSDEYVAIEVIEIYVQ